MLLLISEIDLEGAKSVRLDISDCLLLDDLIIERIVALYVFVSDCEGVCRVGQVLIEGLRWYCGACRIDRVLVHDDALLERELTWDEVPNRRLVEVLVVDEGKPNTYEYQGNNQLTDQTQEIPLVDQQPLDP